MNKQVDESGRGVIFGVHRCSLEDGPGIRTTVFLKGCYLRCIWCHNPESHRAVSEMSYKEELCQKCGSCAGSCEHSGVEGVSLGKGFDRATCKDLEAAASACGYGGLEVVGRTWAIDEVFAEVAKDRVYFEESGGGVTVSGGEPLLQARFAAEICGRAREEGYHVCVETSGVGTDEDVVNLAAAADLFLFDYKATDPEEHRNLTGVSNEIILRNLDMLYRVGAAIRLRCPLVPGINDSAEHLAGIAKLWQRYPKLEGVELMPFHNIGEEKYARFGYVNPLKGKASATKGEIKGWKERLAALGCRTL